MAAKQPTKKQTNTKNTRSSKKKQEEKKRSIIPLLLLIILLLLGVIAYAYRDKLQVAWQSSKTHLQDNHSNKTEKQSDKKHSDKNKSNNDNPLQQAISQLENKFSATTTTTTTTIASRRQSATTTTTVKKFVPVTTTTTTVRKVKATTTTSTTTTTIRRPPEITTTTSTTTTTIAAMKPAKPEKPVVKTRTSKVYFTRVTMDDAYMIAAERTVNYIDSPLTETINVLLQGTNHAEELKYIVTNIPSGTRLLGARISDEVAYLDFSSEFENNTYGKDSTLQQLKQIVYTATEFKGVDAVQFLINGRKQEYLGGEGVLIGDPLHRYDFR